MVKQYQLVNRSFGQLGLSAVIGMGVAILGSLAVAPSQASALEVSGCVFDDSAVSMTWELTGDCNAQTQLNIPSGVTLDGNGFTIRPAYFYMGGTLNDAGIGITDANNVTVRDVVINSGTTVMMYGIDVTASTSVSLTNVTVSNNYGAGVYVFDSHVTATNLTTVNNDSGVTIDTSGGTAASVLTVQGVSHHDDIRAQLYVPYRDKNVVINDVNRQYAVSINIYNTHDAMYTLLPLAPMVSECKNGGWALLRDADGELFGNQGQCVSYVVASDNAQFKR